MAKNNLKFCPDCGEKVSRKAKRCPHCGARLGKNPFVAFLGLIFKTFLVLVVLAIAALFGMRYMNQQAAKRYQEERERLALENPTNTPTPTPTPEVIERAPIGDIEEDIQEEVVVSSGIRPEFKEFMDSYESFYMGYYDLLDKMANDPGDLSILADYTKLTVEVAKWEEELGDWDEDDMNAEELEYYLGVTNRVIQRASETIGG